MKFNTNQTITKSTTLKANVMESNTSFAPYHGYDLAMHTNTVTTVSFIKPSYKFVKKAGKFSNSAQNNYTKEGTKNNKQPRLTGFNLQLIFKSLSLFFPCASILAEASNLAAVTDKYMLIKSHKQLAEISNVSQSTAYRHCNAADALGFITTIPVYCSKTKARLPNTYQLTRQVLDFGTDLIAILKSKRLSFASNVRAIKEEVAKLLIKYNFVTTPPTSKCSTPPRQNDVTNNKYNPVKVRKTKKASPVNSKSVKAVSLTFIQETLAKASAKRSNERRDEARQEKVAINHRIREKATAMAQKMAYFKASNVVKKNEDAFKPDYANTDYSAPVAGFRTA